MTDINPADPQRKKERRQKWILGGLIVSLAINLFVVGAYATFRIGSHRGFGGEMRAIVHAVPDDARKELRKKFRARRGEMRDLRDMASRETAGALKNLAAALRQEPFDKDAAAAILDRAQSRVVDSGERVLRRGWGDVVDILGGLSLEERRELAEALGEASEEIGERRKRWQERRRERRDR